MPADFDFVEESGKTWRYVERLEDEQRERALGLVAQGEARWRRRRGLPPVTRSNPALMRCGHLHKCVRTDEHGVQICTACEWADQQAARP
jgi:hypothetical protein